VGVLWVDLVYGKGEYIPNKYGSKTVSITIFHQIISGIKRTKRLGSAKSEN
jgi:hypothetical protein